MATTYDLGGGGNSFPFERPGDVVTGRIVDIQEIQQTDMDTGIPQTWDNGQPKMMVQVELQTELRDPQNLADDGKRSVYLKGSKKSESFSSSAAVLDAVKAATGSTQLAVGGTLTLQYTGDGVASARGKNPPKQYRAQYVAPSVDLSGGQQQQGGWGSQPPAQPAGQAAGQWGAQPAQVSGGWGQPPQVPAGGQFPPNGNQQPPVQYREQPAAQQPAQQQPDPASDPAYAAYLAWQQTQAQQG
jgi:hypothetical protein